MDNPSHSMHPHWLVTPAHSVEDSLPWGAGLSTTWDPFYLSLLDCITPTNSVWVAFRKYLGTFKTSYMHSISVTYLIGWYLYLPFNCFCFCLCFCFYCTEHVKGTWISLGINEGINKDLILSYMYRTVQFKVFSALCLYCAVSYDRFIFNVCITSFSWCVYRTMLLDGYISLGSIKCLSVPDPEKAQRRGMERGERILRLWKRLAAETEQGHTKLCI